MPLRIPPGLEAPDGAVAALRYRAEATDGAVLAVLNCVIPATARAREVIARRLGIPYAPEVDGVVMIQGCVGDQQAGRTNDCQIAPIVAIGQPVENPCDYDPYCVPDGESGGGGGGTSDPGTGGGGTSCANCGPNAPTLSCGPEASRGSPVTCKVANVGDLDVAGWSFSSGNTAITASGGRTEWSGPAVVTGTVLVSLMDGTGLYAPLTVNDRGWTWASNGVSEFSDGTGTPCLNHTPTFGTPADPPDQVANGLNMEIGWSSCNTTRRFIQPDSYETGDGFTVTTAPSGPNTGMHYVSAATLYLRRTSTINSGLLPSAPAVALSDGPFGQQATRCGSRANWYQFSTCMNADPDGYIAGVRAHEGRGTTGHNGHYSAAYDAAVDPRNDPMKLLDEEVGSNAQNAVDFRNSVKERFRRAARAIDDASLDVSNGGTTVTGNWSGPYYGWVTDHFLFSNTAI